MAPKLPTRKIGNTDVTAIGYGAMGIAAFYGDPLPDEERFKVTIVLMLSRRMLNAVAAQILDAVYESGCTNWDTADLYMDSEDLIGTWFKRTGKRDQIFLATKFGSRPPSGKLVDGSPEYVRQAFDKSVKRLGVEKIDLYYLHRPDPTVPIELTVGAMAELVQRVFTSHFNAMGTLTRLRREGKVKYLGLSEVSASTLRRAYAVHPIAAIQVEYSPFTLDIEANAVLQTARELGVAVIAYSPLGRGLLTGKYKGPEDFAEDDFRRRVPRYSKENFPKILKLADDLKVVGDRHGASSGQVALAWLLAQGPEVIPIPGTRNVKYLRENLGALDVQLTSDDVQDVRRIAEDADNFEEGRYPPGLQELLFADTPPLP
ncbi:Aldo/keto reductase [Artomyces pyxidatus]|uniref:Aldo/keto reductase n=1 Tax=Artomyces pyxidatus TaxID=48021 RepID=A0ACB8T4Y2_9AGAM|nr:Aldo/keto reductase [Artomyces pyxidatus]